MEDNNSTSNNSFQAFWLVLGSLSSLALAIVSAAILSRYLDKSQYGTYRQILYIYTTLAVIFSAGLPRVFAYFLPRYSLSEGKNIVKKVTIVLFFSGLLFSSFLYFFSGIIANLLNNKELEVGLRTFAIIPTLLLPTLGIEGIFSTYKKTIYVAIYNTFTRLLTLLFIVLPVILFNGSYLTALYGWIVVSFISLIIAMYLKGLPFKEVKSVKTSLSIKEIFRYSVPLVLASVWGILISASDQFYISRYFGTTVFAEFSNGFAEVPFVGMVTLSASTVMMPIFSKMVFEKTSTEELIKVWKNVLYKSALIIYPIVIFFLFFAKEIMVLLYSEKYVNSATYFQINIFYNLFNIIIFAPLLFAMGKTKVYANIHMILAISSWTLGFIIVYTFNSPVAVAILSVFLKISKIVIFVFLIGKVLKVSVWALFPIKNLMVIIIHNLLIGTLVWILYNYILFSSLVLLKLAISFISYATILLISSYYVKIDYMMALNPIIKKVKNKYFSKK